MKSLLKITICIFTLAALVSCRDKTTRKVQYMPDMYRPVPYEVYGENPNFKNGLSSQQPVVGTIARGQVPYDYPNTEAGYQDAKLNYKSPLDSTNIDTKKGKILFNMYCAICHGTNGNGQGYLSERDKLNGVPNYNSREITQGSIYHVIMYGRGVMGSHASQLRDEERWQVTHYVEKLRKDLLK